MDPREIVSTDAWFDPTFGERIELNHQNETYQMLEILEEGVNAAGGSLAQRALTEAERNTILSPSPVQPPVAPSAPQVDPPAPANVQRH
jgi:hypothetical protein